MKTILFILTCLLSLIFSNIANATPIKLNTDYTIINNPNISPQQSKNKVEVIEFFSFNCFHCKSIEPLLEQYMSSNKNVALEKIQIVFDNNFIEFGKLSATFQLMNLNRLYVPAFDAIFNQTNLNDPQVLPIFLSKNGLTKNQIDTFMNNYNSFAVNTTVGKYRKLTAQYNIMETPTVIVENKYLISPANPTRIIEVLGELVKKINLENKTAKAHKKNT